MSSGGRGRGGPGGSSPQGQHRSAGPSFGEFFAAATGREAGDFVRSAAERGLTKSLVVPAGADRAEVILAWLWRRLRGPDRDAGAAAPRRLIYALPQRSLVEPAAVAVAGWMARLEITDRVALHATGVWLGGDLQWRRDLYRPAVVIGTADVLVSKALNRGYGVGRVTHPIDFALTTNGAHWVFAHASLCPAAVSTIGQIAGLTAMTGRCESFEISCLSVTGPQSPVVAGDLAAAAGSGHRPGGRTLIVANTVAGARRAYAALAGGPVPSGLLHPQFRGRERLELARAVTAEVGPAGQIVVATAGVAAGLDVQAGLVVTEAAGSSGPVEPGGRFGLGEVTALFDTSPDQEMIDIGPFAGDGAEPEAQLAWVTWEADGGPPAEARLPAEEWRCRAPLGLVDRLAARAPVWRMDWAQRCWTALTPAEPARPGELLLVAAADGGYDPLLGFDPELVEAVADAPSVDPVAAELGDGPGWVSLRQHSEETRDQAAALLAAIGPELPAAARAAVVCAAYLHDAGKAHPIWQDALCALAAPEDRDRVAAGRPWAKSGTSGVLAFAGDVSFRHELASLLLLDGPLQGLIDGSADRDLVRYLVLAHHGRLRVRVQDPAPAGPTPASTALFGLEPGVTWSMPSGFSGSGVDAGDVALTVDLEQFGPDAGSWAATVRGLLDRYGPFVLAYAETIVRIADWRASGGDSLPLVGDRDVVQALS